MSDPMSTGQSLSVTQSLPSGSPPKVGSGAPAGVSVRTKVDAVGSPSLTGQAVLVEFVDAPRNGKEAKPPASEDDAAKAFKEFLGNLPNSLELKADKESGYTIYKVINPTTREVIRQYPADQMVEMAKRIRQQLTKEDSGILLDEKS